MDYKKLLLCLQYVKFSEHFSAYEMFHSSSGWCHGLANVSDDSKVWQNLCDIAYFLEDVRKLLKCPLIINSGYRSSAVNSLVGGVSDSYHLKGLAVDIRISRKSVTEYVVCLNQVIKSSSLPYKITYITKPEKGYIHVQFKPF